MDVKFLIIILINFIYGYNVIKFKLVIDKFLNCFIDFEVGCLKNNYEKIL